MPLTCRPEQLQPGMQLYDSIRSGTLIMLRAGHELTEDDIAALRRRFPNYLVRVWDPRLDSLLVFDEEQREVEFAERATLRSRECAQRVIEDLQSHRRSNSNYHAIERTVSNVISYIISHPVGQVLPRNHAQSGAYLPEHMSEVFCLSMMLASKVREYIIDQRSRQTACRGLPREFAADLLPLGIAALYADVGMQDLADLDRQPQPLGDADWKRIFQHPLVSCSRLSRLAPTAARAVVLTHHINADGSGYPCPMPPDKVHVFTRIVRLVDTFAAATTARPYRAALSPLRILWEMTHGSIHTHYDPTLVRALCDLCPPFQLGTVIDLCDGRRAVVTGQSSNPFVPRVVIALDAQGNLLPPEQMSESMYLASRGQLKPAKVDGEDVSYLYGRCPVPQPAVA